MTPPALRIVGPSDPDGDADVVRRVAGGDIGALGVLYDRHAPALLRFIRKHSPKADSEDILQDTFLRALEVAGRFEPRSSARPWLFGISIQVLRERRRSIRRLATLLTSLAARPLRVSPEPNATARDIQRALERLSDAKRTVVLLAEVEGFPCGEIAEILGVPLGTVWTRLHHARRALKKSLEESR